VDRQSVRIARGSGSASGRIRRPRAFGFEKAADDAPAYVREREKLASRVVYTSDGSGDGSITNYRPASPIDVN